MQREYVFSAMRNLFMGRIVQNRTAEAAARLSGLSVANSTLHAGSCPFRYGSARIERSESQRARPAFACAIAASADFFSLVPAFSPSHASSVSEALAISSASNGT